MKRVFFKAALTMAVCVMLNCNTVISYAHESLAQTEMSVSSKGSVTVKGVEKIWRYRYYNGKKQKRLWSCTDNCWITDHWIDV